MQLLEGIYQRSSIGKVRLDAPPRAEIEAILEAAVQAPNHRVTEPWHFFVLTGKSREKLGEFMEALLMRKKPESNEEERARERAKPLRAPVLIVVTSAPGKDEIETVENFAATAAAVENLLLAAHARGLAAQWRTGDPAYSAEVKQWLGVSDDTAITAIVYVGYADMDPKPRRRVPAVEKTEWRS